MTDAERDLVARWLAQSKVWISIAVAALYGTLGGLAGVVELSRRYAPTGTEVGEFRAVGGPVMALAYVFVVALVAMIIAAMLHASGERRAVDVDRALGLAVRRLLRYLARTVAVPLRRRRTVLSAARLIDQRADRAWITSAAREPIVAAARSDDPRLATMVRDLLVAHVHAEVLDVEGLATPTQRRERTAWMARVGAFIAPIVPLVVWLLDLFVSS